MNFECCYKKFVYFFLVTLISSTSKMSVALGKILSPAPFEPYANSLGINRRYFELPSRNYDTPS